MPNPIVSRGMSAAVLATALFVLSATTDADGKVPVCPPDMRAIEHVHHEATARPCTDRRGPGRCYRYKGGKTRGIGRARKLAFCMDVYEAPNKKGEKPLVMESAVSAEAWCKARGKRLCTEYEWESACEGPELLAYPYGNEASGDACNSGKTWRSPDAKTLLSGGPKSEKELARLWQGEVSGARTQCISGYGIYDMTGNVEEWVASSRPYRKYSRMLTGGFWAKKWPSCRDANATHENTFRYYETGFRCCRDWQTK